MDAFRDCFRNGWSWRILPLQPKTAFSRFLPVQRAHSVEVWRRHFQPPGEKQMDYHENSDQWVPRGDVLRCIIDDGGPDGEVTIHIDDQELSLAEFGRLLRVHAGSGMRIAFVPEEFISENPKVEIRKPKRRKR